MSSAYQPPFPRWRRWAVGAVLAALLGAIGYAYFDGLADRRVTHGVAVDARVTDVQAIPVQRVDLPQLVTVSYRFEGGTRSARLVAPLFAPNHRVGDTLTVHLDPGHPERVATSDGLASEGLVLLVPPALVFYGIVCLVVVGAARLRWWLRHERAASGPVPALTINGLVEEGDRLAPWSRAIERLMAAATAASGGAAGAGGSGSDGAGLRMYLVYRVPESPTRRHPRAPRAVWYSRRRRRVTVEAWVAAGADADTEVVRLLEQALGVAESHARRHGIDPPGPELGRVVQRTVESYQRRS